VRDNPRMDELEGRVFSRYLIGREASAGLLRRYAEACRELTPDEGQGGVVEFASRRPWSLPFLDAAESLLNRNGPLRSRLLLMLALLEATPEHADRFLPRPDSFPALVLRSATDVVVSAVKIAIGVLIVRPWARAHGNS